MLGILPGTTITRTPTRVMRIASPPVQVSNQLSISPHTSTSSSRDDALGGLGSEDTKSIPEAGNRDGSNSRAVYDDVKTWRDETRRHGIITSLVDFAANSDLRVSFLGYFEMNSTVARSIFFFLISTSVSTAWGLIK